jgi:hypothetical protein
MAYKDSKTKKTVRVPLIGIPLYRDTGARDQKYINVLVESNQNKQAQDTQHYAIKRPGLVQFSRPSGGAATGRGMYSWNGNLYSVFGSGTGALYKDNVALSVPAPGIAAGTNLCDFEITSAIAGTPYLAVNDGSNMFLVNGAGTVTKVTDGDYPASNLGVVVFFDGYILVAKSNGKIYNSVNENPASWNGTGLGPDTCTDFLQAQMFPDNLVSIARQNNMLVAFGQWSTEFFYDAGNPSPGSFMAKLDQGALQVGCAGINTVMQHEDFVIWVARAQTGGYTVQKLEGITNLKTVSTDPVERLLNSEGASGTLSSAVAWAVRVGGHFIYVLTLPTLNRTLVYDIDEDRWTEFQGGSSGRFPYVWSTQHNNVPLVQHETNGRIYQFSDTVYQDDGASIYTILQTRKYDADTSYRKFCSRLELVGDKTNSTSSIDVQYSDDDYQNFSTARTVDANADRMFLTRLGSFRRRAWKFTHTANTPLRLEAYEMDLQLGEQ